MFNYLLFALVSGRFYFIIGMAEAAMNCLFLPLGPQNLRSYYRQSTIDNRLIMRISNIRILTWILFIILLAGLFNLQVSEGETYFSLSNRNCIRVIPYEGIRGRIFDCNGQVIADNRISYNVSILYNEFKKSRELRRNWPKFWVNLSPG